MKLPKSFSSPVKCSSDTHIFRVGRFVPDGAIKVSHRGLRVWLAQSAGCLPSIPETLGSLSSTL